MLLSIVSLMLVGAVSGLGLVLDFAVMTVLLVALIALAARLYPGLAR